MARVPDARIAIRVQPRARRDELAGERDGRLLVRVTAPPLDGRANDAVCRLIADRAALPRSRVTVVQGARGRDKLILVEGVGEDELRARLSPGGA
jgi:uncharacterized protein (TIGR00251 family)